MEKNEGNLTNGENRNFLKSKICADLVKLQNRIRRNRIKEAIWMAKITTWRIRNSTKSEYSENHPEEKKYQKIRKRLDTLFQRLETEKEECIKMLAGCKN